MFQKPLSQAPGRLISPTDVAFHLLVQDLQFTNQSLNIPFLQVLSWIIRVLGMPRKKLNPEKLNFLHFFSMFSKIWALSVRVNPEEVWIFRKPHLFGLPLTESAQILENMLKKGRKFSFSRLNFFRCMPKILKIQLNTYKNGIFNG